MVGRQLHRSPSAVFCQIRQLEEELGVELYEHVGGKLRLTREGQRLAREGDKLVENHDAVLASFQGSQAARRPLLRIGCGPYGSGAVVPHLLRALLAKRPTTEPRLTTADDVCLINDLRLGTLDVILMSLPMNQPGLTEEPLWSYEEVFILSPSLHPDDDGSVLARLKEFPFIVYRRGPVVEGSFRELCDDLGFELNVVMENDGVDSIKALVKLGLGIAFLPLWTVAEDSDLRIVYPPVRRRRDYGFIYRAAKSKPTALIDLLEVAQNWQQWWPLARHVQGPLP